ncbi:hypothetical protein MRX96_025003 [Rhipicephalus microplus]
MRASPTKLAREEGAQLPEAASGPTSVIDAAALNSLSKRRFQVYFLCRAPGWRCAAEHRDISVWILLRAWHAGRPAVSSHACATPYDTLRSFEVSRANVGTGL